MSSVTECKVTRVCRDSLVFRRSGGIPQADVAEPETLPFAGVGAVDLAGVVDRAGRSTDEGALWDGEWSLSGFEGVVLHGQPPQVGAAEAVVALAFFDHRVDPFHVGQGLLCVHTGLVEGADDILEERTKILLIGGKIIEDMDQSLVIYVMSILKQERKNDLYE